MTHSTFAAAALQFNRSLIGIEQKLDLQLPPQYRLMNPFATGKALDLSAVFYRQFYSDNKKRHLILGINPGRHGAGVTGIPFTDTKRMREIGIDPQDIRTYEVSAEFMSQLMHQYGGTEKFYADFYINSPSPLGLLQQNSKGNWINANYYDHRTLSDALSPLIAYAIDYYCQMPIHCSTVYVLGQGQNYKFLTRWNTQHPTFDRVIPLPHPRYVMQYQHKNIATITREYLMQLQRNKTGA